MFTLRSSAARDSSSNLAVAMSRFDFMDRHLQSPIQVRETRSASLRYERQTSCRCRGLHQQSRLCARKNPQLRRSPTLWPLAVCCTVSSRQASSLLGVPPNLSDGISYARSIDQDDKNESVSSNSSIRFNISTLCLNRRLAFLDLSLCISSSCTGGVGRW